MKKHWTQTPEGREKMRQIALATDSISKARKVKAEKANGETKEVSLVINGWKVTVLDNEVRIKR